MRAPVNSDAASIHRLIAECPPLDLNSLYAYLLLTEHHSHTCIAAGSGEFLDGFISAYFVPERPDVLFVWQVAVHPRARGRALARRMLDALLRRPATADARYLETTVGQDNQASRKTFSSIAHSLSAPLIELPLFEPTLFGEQNHESEPLLRIGPFRAT
ncbi:MAG: diaminobutyrate acetyltransferase [Candidimonas sp.]|nr:diaminobutyrate acetyltransferase [Candidimonas sp.]